MSLKTLVVFFRVLTAFFFLKLECDAQILEESFGKTSSLVLVAVSLLCTIIFHRTC